MSWTHFLFSFQGRVNRSAFWLRFTLPYWGIYIVVTVVDVVIFDTFRLGNLGLLSGLFSLLLIWPFFAVSVKRLQDRDKSAWWLLLTVIPIVGTIWYLIGVGFLRGTKGPNRYSPDPLGSEPLAAETEEPLPSA